MRIPDAGAVQFTRAGNALTFALQPPPEDTIPADSLVGKAMFDLWTYKDAVLMPTQKLRVAQDRNRRRGRRLIREIAAGSVGGFLVLTGEYGEGFVRPGRGILQSQAYRGTHASGGASANRVYDHQGCAGLIIQSAVDFFGSA